jgi:hypothetical protein
MALSFSDPAPRIELLKAVESVRMWGAQGPIRCLTRLRPYSRLRSSISGADKDCSAGGV